METNDFNQSRNNSKYAGIFKKNQKILLNLFNYAWANTYKFVNIYV